MPEEPRIKHEPHPGPQDEFLNCKTDICVYGGAAGGGKSWGLLATMQRYTFVDGFGAVVFRRTCPQITNEGGLWDESMQMFPQFAGEPKIGSLEWTFKARKPKSKGGGPGISSISFRHLQYESDKLSWQGSQICGIGFDELTHFTEGQFWYFLSRNRSACGVNPFIRATTNPVPADDPVGGWVNRLVSWWIDQDTGYAIPERSGVIRWLVRVNNEIHWGRSQQELYERHCDTSLPIDHEDQPCIPKSFAFIAANLKDNPSMGKEYRANLMMMAEHEKEQLLHGNWNAKAQAGTFFKVAKIKVEDVAPRMLRICRAWDLAATDGAGDYTAGGHIGIDADGLIWILDMRRGQWEANYRDNVIVQTAELDQCPIRLPQDPGAAGKSEAARMVRMLRGHNVKSLPVSGDKQTRASGFSSQVNAGNVRMLRDTPENRWNSGLLQRLDAFPTKGVPDDEIDCLSDAFAEVAKPSSTAFVGQSNEGEKEPDHKSSALFVDDYVRDEWARIVREDSVCPRWKDSLADFRYDIGERPTKEHTLRLRDGNGMYEPTNVWWGRDGDLPPVVVKKRVLAFVGR